MTPQELNDFWLSLKNEFLGLEFYEDTHTYFVGGVRLPSVSSLIGNFYIPFDTPNEAIKYATKRQLDVDDILAGWKGENLISTSHGSAVHIFGEDYVKWKYFGIGTRPLPFDKQTLAVVQFWTDLPPYFVPVALELQMYSRRFKYCGTADILLLNLNTGKFVIADYKTNKDLFDADPTFPSAPMLHLDSSLGLLQNNFGKYSLQFSFYQIMMEEVGIDVTSRMLIWLREDKANKKLYTTYRTTNLTKSLSFWLDKCHLPTFK